MSTYDLRARQQAVRTLALKSAGGKGGAVTLERLTGSTRNNTTLTTTPTYADAENGSGVSRAYRGREIDGTRIKVGDVLLLLSPETVDGADLGLPVTGSRVTIGDKAWRVEAVETVQPADIVVMHKLHLRGAA